MLVDSQALVCGGRQGCLRCFDLGACNGIEEGECSLFPFEVSTPILGDGRAGTRNAFWIQTSISYCIAVCLLIIFLECVQ